MLACLIFSPLVQSIPGFATAPALLYVGAQMLRSAREIDWDDMTEAAPAFLTIVFMPFTYSIADGIAFAVADDGGQGGAPVNIGQTNRAAAADGSNQAGGRPQVDADGETVLMRSGGHAGFGNLQKSHDCVPFDAVFIRIVRYFNRFREDS